MGDATIECLPLLTGPVANAVQTTVDDDSAIAEGRRANHRAWNAVINLLLDWMRDPSLVEDEGIAPTDQDSIKGALKIASRLKQDCVAAPTRVVPSPDGEVVFEREDGDTFESMTFTTDGGFEYRLFEGTVLIDEIQGH